MDEINKNNKKTPFLVIHPGEILQDELDARGLTQTEFAAIIGRPVRTVNEIINGKRAITLDTARLIGVAFNTSSELWFNMQSEYDLFNLKDQSKVEDAEVRERSSLYSCFPVAELIERHYVAKKIKVSDLGDKIFNLLGIKNLDEFNKCCAEYKKSECGEIKENYLKTWVLLGKKQAVDLKVGKYDSKGLAKFVLEIKKYSLEEKDGIKKVIGILNSLGVRIVFLPHFAKTRVDGAVVWISDDEPVVIMSLRYDRIDNFYFTLLHEIGHILKHPRKEFRDDMSNLSGEIDEKKANDFAVSVLGLDCIEKSQLRGIFVDSLFIKAKSKEIGLHPGLLIGRMHYERILNYGQYRKSLVKIKETVPVNLQLK